MKDRLVHMRRANLCVFVCVCVCVCVCRFSAKTFLNLSSGNFTALDVCNRDSIRLCDTPLLIIETKYNIR